MAQGNFGVVVEASVPLNYDGHVTAKMETPPHIVITSNGYTEEFRAGTKLSTSAFFAFGSKAYQQVDDAVVINPNTYSITLTVTEYTTTSTSPPCSTTWTIPATSTRRWPTDQDPNPPSCITSLNGDVATGLTSGSLFAAAYIHLDQYNTWIEGDSMQTIPGTVWYFPRATVSSQICDSYLQLSTTETFKVHILNPNSVTANVQISGGYTVNVGANSKTTWSPPSSFPSGSSTLKVTSNQPVVVALESHYKDDCGQFAGNTGPSGWPVTNANWYIAHICSKDIVSVWNPSSSDANLKINFYYSDGTASNSYLYTLSTGARADLSLTSALKYDFAIGILSTNNVQIVAKDTDIGGCLGGDMSSAYGTPMAQLTVFAVYATGQAIGGATVTIDYASINDFAGAGGVDVAVGTTDANGLVAFSLPSGESYSVQGSYSRRSASASLTLLSDTSQTLTFPPCVANANPTSGAFQVTVSFSASCADGVMPYSYSWNYQDTYDPGTSSSPTPSHTYYWYGSGISTTDYYPTVVITDTNGRNWNPTVPTIAVYCRTRCPTLPSP